jgi:GTP-binding protein Era
MTTEHFEFEDLIPSTHQLESMSDNPDVSRAWEEASAQMDKTIVISFMGTADSGKTSCIKALYQVDLGTISPVSGSTKEVRVLPVLVGPPEVFAADCPGFGDIDKAVEGKAREMIKESDAFIYLFGARPGLLQQEQKDLAAIRATGKPVLVVLNQIDLIAEKDRDGFIANERAKVGGKDFIVAALDPDSRFKMQPIGIEAIRRWIADKVGPLALELEKGERDAVTNKWILGAAGAAFGAGALPIPGSDIFLITALQAGLLVKIARVYGHRVEKKDAVALIAQVFTGQVGRQVFRWAITALKAAGWIPGPGWILELAVAGIAGSVGASITYGLGKAAQAYYRSGMQIPIEDIQQIYKQASTQYRDKPATAELSDGK